MVVVASGVVVAVGVVVVVVGVVVVSLGRLGARYTVTSYGVELW